MPDDGAAGQRTDPALAYLSGVAALARAPLLQRERDIAQGFKTAGYATGYRGSPLGTLDMEIEALSEKWRARDLHFQPGVNEDLAATAIWGSQQAALSADARIEGVIGLWYGKGPGVDRSGDAMKHANFAGTARLGGVLALCGDDHGAKSSTAPHQSAQALVAAMIPMLAPSSVQELIDFSLRGWEMSRWSGVWTALLCPTDLVEQATSVSLDAFRLPLVDMKAAPSAESVSIRIGFTPLDDERRLLEAKLPAAQDFARRMGLDREIIPRTEKTRFGVVTTGKAHQDFMEALRLLGLDEARAVELGLAVYKIGLAWPIESEGARDFARGLNEVLVVEEKRAFVEDQLSRILYDLPDTERPRLSGKRAAGRALLSEAGELTPLLAAEALAARLRENGIEINPPTKTGRPDIAPPSLRRTPHYCAGCPHNTSTKAREGQTVFGGIGCHGMAAWMPDRPTRGLVQMGGEGAIWIGQARFVNKRHAFQNLGDGTYFHSASLAVRAAVAAKVNLTYRILYNDAVAMTGGQPIDGTLDIGALAGQLLAEGVREIVIVADDPARRAGLRLPRGVTIEPRENLPLVEQRLAAVEGVTAVIYDQPCAAELRRKRRAGEAVDPALRLFIHEDVCEGCGDCAAVSNCVAVLPLETVKGRKRTIDQSACNKDASCVEGFCPSFVTVEGGVYEPLGARAIEVDALGKAPPPPNCAAIGERDTFGVLLAGIGGTGVVTLGAIIRRAAEIAGFSAASLDITGLAQKNGAVWSHLRIGKTAEEIKSVRLAEGDADLILGCDPVVAASEETARAIRAGRTRAIVNENVAPTAQIFADPDLDFNAAPLIERLRALAGKDVVSSLDAQKLAVELVGDAICANIVLLGFAAQKGALPMDASAIMRAIEENPKGGARNLRAFELGRRFAHDPASVEEFLSQKEPPLEQGTLEEIISRCKDMLVSYQNVAYARRFEKTVARAAKAEKALGRDGFARAAALSLFKLMAYKDEYEVARLYTASPALSRIRSSFRGDAKLCVHLAPPFFARQDLATGLPAKRKFGAWVFALFRMLAPLRVLRGTPFDIFGYLPERRMERALIADFEREVEALCSALGAETFDACVEIARLPMAVRGFGHIKERAVEKVAEERCRLWARLTPTAAAGERYA